jgi:hypothetical protein
MCFVHDNQHSVEIVAAPHEGFFFALTLLHDHYKDDPKVVSHIAQLVTECLRNDPSSITQDRLEAVGMQTRLKKIRGMQLNGNDGNVFDVMMREGGEGR